MRLFASRFRNAAGTSVIMLESQSSNPGVVGLYTAPGSGSFSVGQNVTYQNGNTVISGVVKQITDNSGPDSFRIYYISYSGSFLGIIHGGTMFAAEVAQAGTVDTAATTAATSAATDEVSYADTAEDSSGMIVPSTQPMTSKPVIESGFNPLLLIGLGVGAFFLFKIAK
jgi:hypothetical protein